MEFGVTFMLDPPVSRTVGWAKRAEEVGFDYVWAWDSHVLWQEFYVTFTLIAAATSNGSASGPASPTRPPATPRSPPARHRHPATRSPAAAWTSGIGRGDSARRVIGKTPVTVERHGGEPRG